MNNKEFIAELSRRCEIKPVDAQTNVSAAIKLITEHLCQEDTVQINGFGSFEPKKRLERVLVNPTTGQRMLVPPKIVANFKPSTTLKNKLQ